MTAVEDILSTTFLSTEVDVGCHTILITNSGVPIAGQLPIPTSAYISFYDDKEHEVGQSLLAIPSAAISIQPNPSGLYTVEIEWDAIDDAYSGLVDGTAFKVDVLIDADPGGGTGLPNAERYIHKEFLRNEHHAAVGRLRSQGLILQALMFSNWSIANNTLTVTMPFGLEPGEGALEMAKHDLFDADGDATSENPASRSVNSILGMTVAEVIAYFTSED